MMIIGCDFHPRFQQIAFVDEQTGEYGERRLNHPGEAEQFYRSLAGRTGADRFGGDGELSLVPALAERVGL